MDEYETYTEDSETQTSNINESQEESTQEATQEFKSVLLRLDTKLTTKVDAFKTDRGFSNRTEAIRYLMTLGLKEADSEGALRLRVTQLEDIARRQALL